MISGTQRSNGAGALHLFNVTTCFREAASRATLIVQGAHSLLGLALPPTEGHVRGRHIPQMKQCQATLGEQLGNMDSTWLCDGQSGWQGALPSWTLTIGNHMKQARGKEALQVCTSVHTHTHTRTEADSSLSSFSYSKKDMLHIS